MFNMFVIGTRIEPRRWSAPWLVRRALRLVGACLALCAAMSAQAGIPATERAVLQAIYTQTYGAGWINQAGWDGPPGTECNWAGVTCNAADTTVIGLDLSGNGLFGILPPLAGLTNLETFNVGQVDRHEGFYNSLFGPIPQLDELKHLKSFIAGGAFFSGDLPSLAGMSSLEHFECRYCGLDGHIVSLEGLTHLKYFAVTGFPLNGWLHGSIPSLAGSPQLQYFRLSGKFTGKLPDLTGLTRLQTFRVRGYRFTGGLPDLVDMPELEWFEVHGMVSGHIGRLSNLPSLQKFDVWNNLLTGDIPALSEVPNLKRFAAGRNQISGTIPKLTELDNLQSFSVPYNQLSGPLPTPPQSLINKSSTAIFGSGLCPNMLVPASNPPSATDKEWGAITEIRPWSRDCSPYPLWYTFVDISSNLSISQPDEAVTYAAVVRGMNPTGSVTFNAQSIEPGDWPLITLCKDVPIIDAVASCSYGGLDPWGFEYGIFAFYSGDANNAPGHSRYSEGYPTFTDLYQVVKGPVVETTTDATAQVGQPVDLTLTYGVGVDGDTARFTNGRSLRNVDGTYHNLICSDVPVHTARSGKYIAHCVARFDTVGAQLLTATTDKSRANAEPIIQHVVAATPFDADQFALTGPWYEPSTSGQGLEFVVYPDLQVAGVATLVGGWFTYGEAGKQRWFSLQGDLAESHGGTFDLTVGQGGGGRFNVGPTIEPAVVGSAELTFYDCGHAALTFTLDDGRSGTIPYVRLDAPTACSSAVPATLPATLPEHYSDVAHSGAWYNPATSGQGLFVDFVPRAKTFFGLWFTYAPSSDSADSGVARQRWFALQASTTPGDLALHDVAIIASSSGVFNQPSPIAIGQVGTADITFTSCTTMTLHYHFDNGEFAGLDGTIDEHILSAPSPACH